MSKGIAHVLTSGREDERTSPERSDRPTMHPLSDLSAAGSNLA